MQTFQEDTAVIQVKGDSGLAQGSGNGGREEWSVSEYISEYILVMFKVEPKSDILGAM